MKPSKLNNNPSPSSTTTTTNKPAHKLLKWASLMERLQSLKHKQKRQSTFPRNLAGLQRTAPGRKIPSRVEEWRRDVREEMIMMGGVASDSGYGFGRRKGWEEEYRGFEEGEGRREEGGGVEFWVVEEVSWVGMEEREESERVEERFDEEVGAKRWWYGREDSQGSGGHMECEMQPEFWEEDIPVEYVFVVDFDMWEQRNGMHNTTNASSTFQQESRFDLRLRHEKLVATLEEVIRRIDQVEFRYSMAYSTQAELLEDMLDTTYNREYLHLLSAREHLLKELEILENEAHRYGMGNVPPPTPPQHHSCQCHYSHDQADLPHRPPPASPKIPPPTRTRTRSMPYMHRSTSTNSRPPPAKALPVENPRLHLEKYNQKWKDLLLLQQSSPTKPPPSKITLPWPSPSPTFSRTSLSHPPTTFPTPALASKWPVQEFFCHAFNLVPLSHLDTNTDTDTNTGTSTNTYFGFRFPDDKAWSAEEKGRCLEALRKQLKMEMVRWHEDKLRLLVGEEGARDEMVKVVWGAVLELRGRVEEELGRLVV